MNERTRSTGSRAPIVRTFTFAWLAFITTSVGISDPTPDSSKTTYLRIRALEAALKETSDPWVAKNSRTLRAKLARLKGQPLQAAALEDRRLLPQRIARRLEPWRALINVEARRAGLRPELVAAVIWTESAGDPNALSRKGARGLMQLMPQTAAGLGVRDAFDPRENIIGGITYLAQLISQFEQDIPLALAAYNAGPTRIASGRAWPRETRNYVKRVLAIAEALIAE